MDGQTPDHGYTISFSSYELKTWMLLLSPNVASLVLHSISKIKIHLSNVLTDHFSNSFSEKTTNDIPMKFLVSFQDDFLLVAATKSWNLLKNHSCETKCYFLV